jgi:hypothetical protein
MLSIILMNNGEPKVMELTMENISKELQSVPEAELLVASSIFSGLSLVTTDYVCFLEADCLVSSGYFSSMLGLFKKNPHFRQLAMLSSATGVKYFHNRVYGFEVCTDWSKPTTRGKANEIRTLNPNIHPIKAKKSSSPYSVKIGFYPGAIIRTKALKEVLDKYKKKGTNDLLNFSTVLSFGFWESGRRVLCNPNATYVTTETSIDKYAPQFMMVPTKAGIIFEKERI